MVDGDGCNGAFGRLKYEKRRTETQNTGAHEDCRTMDISEGKSGFKWDVV